MTRAWAAILLLSGSVLPAGCRSVAPPPPAAPAPLAMRLHLETRPGEAGVPVTLPRSGVRIDVAVRPVFTELDLVNAEVAEVELGRCLWLQFSPVAARDLHRLYVTAAGRRLVVVLDGAALGARRLDAAPADGELPVFVETADENLVEIVARLKRTAADLAAARRP